MSQAQWAGLVIMILSVIGMLIVTRIGRGKRRNRRKSGFMGKKTWF